MKELLKESFELWCKKRWLKAIGKEIDRYNHLHNKTKRQYYVLSTMVNRFNEIYGEDLTLVGNKQIDLRRHFMNWESALNFAFAALNFALMIWSISNNSWAFAINLAAGIFCLLMGIVSLNK